MKQAALFCFFLLALLTSCNLSLDITKKRYSPGFTINSAFNKVKDQHPEIKAAIPEPELHPVLSKEIVLVEPPFESTLEASTNNSNSAYHELRHIKRKYRENKVCNDSMVIKKGEVRVKNEDRVIEPLSIISIVSFLISCFLRNYGFFLALGASVLGIVSLIKVLKNKSKYKFKVLTVIATILATIFITLLLLVTIVILYFIDHPIHDI
jgi:hypothetical protein